MRAILQKEINLFFSSVSIRACSISFLSVISKLIDRNSKILPELSLTGTTTVSSQINSPDLVLFNISPRHIFPENNDSHISLQNSSLSIPASSEPNLFPINSGFEYPNFSQKRSLTDKISLSRLIIDTNADSLSPSFWEFSLLFIFDKSAKVSSSFFVLSIIIVSKPEFIF